MTIIWMQHPQHGKFPCTSSDVELYRKNGWTELKAEKKIEPPPEPIQSEVASDEAEQSELGREDLLKMAEEAGVEINKKWSTVHIRKVLGL